MTHRAPTALAEDWSEHSAWVRRLLRGMVRDPHLADDISQDALAAGLELSRLVPDRPRAWLHRVARNLLAKRLRGDARRDERERLTHPQPPATPDEIVERVERQQLVAGEVLALPEDYKNALLLHYYEGASIATIADRLSVPVRTVQTRLYRARRLLRDRLSNRLENWAGVLLPLCAAGSGAASADALAVGVAGPGVREGASGWGWLKIAVLLVGGVAIPGWLLLEFSSVQGAWLPAPESVSLVASAPAPVAGRKGVAAAPGGLRTELAGAAQGKGATEGTPSGGFVAGRLVGPAPAAMDALKTGWAVRVRRIQGKPSAQGPWMDAQNASTYDHRPNAMERWMPRTGIWLPGQAEGTHAYVRAKGKFRHGPLATGRYDLLVERDDLPVAIVRGVDVGNGTKQPGAKAPAVNLERLDVHKLSRVMRLTVEDRSGKPLHVRPILVFSPQVYFQARRGAKGSVELRCPLGTSPDVVLAGGASRPQRIPWRDGEQKVVLERRGVVYLRAASPVRVGRGVQMPYLLLAPREPVLGLPPAIFGTVFQLRPLAEGKTLALPVFVEEPHCIRQQTGTGFGKPDPRGEFRHPVVGFVPIPKGSPIQPTLVTLPDPVRRPKGVTGSVYVRMPSRVVDLDELLREQHPKKGR